MFCTYGLNSAFILFIKIFQTIVARFLEDGTGGVFEKSGRESVENSVEIYPNPSSDILKLKATEALKGSVRVFDYNKLKIQTGNNLTLNEVSIDISSLSSGIYHVVIQLDNSSEICKTLIVK